MNKQSLLENCMLGDPFYHSWLLSLNTGLLAHIAKGDGSRILKLHGVSTYQHQWQLVLTLAVRSAEDARSNAVANNRATAVGVWT